jgi:AICAR transformylase/IMP cyclohydrolase PurH
VTRTTANLSAPERVQQSACASEGAGKLSIGAGHPSRSATQRVAMNKGADKAEHWGG